MKNILLIFAAFWFGMGFYGSYIVDTNTNIVIARFSLALFMVITALGIEILDRLKKIMEQKSV